MDLPFKEDGRERLLVSGVTCTVKPNDREGQLWCVVRLCCQGTPILSRRPDNWAYLFTHVGVQSKTRGKTNWHICEKAHQR